MKPIRLGGCDLYIGTCSWRDHANFYPDGMPDPRKITFYAERFPFVEVDSSFYGMPSSRNCSLWAKRTPEGFRFGFKAYSVMTLHGRHEAGKRVPEEPTRELFAQFAEALRPIWDAGKLAYILFQFPPWFTPWKRGEQGPNPYDYIARCADWMEGLPIAVEFRNAYWLQGERAKRTLDLLRERGIAYTCVDEPQVGMAHSVPPIAGTTADFSVVRFHGRRADTWAKRGVGVAERFAYQYSLDELAEWVPRLQKIAAGARAAYVGFNNCFADFAVSNAQQLRQMLLEM
ncbi:MAG: DUF72 domain-containing protein [Armatimonadota bacterium]